MESLVLLALLIIFAPLILSIIALVKISSLKDELKRLREQLQFQSRQFQNQDKLKPIRSVPIVEKKEDVGSAVPRAPKPKPVVAAPVKETKRSPEVPAKKTAGGIEFLMGGKAAAFAGIAILVMGIVFLVGYAIQHSWLGPGARVLLGLLSGLVLVGLAFWINRKDEKYRIFSIVLTGGGSALFYFTVFMAFAFYQLIGPWAAGVGLFICAAAVFGLAMLYKAQSVAVLGVLGAFVTPVLIGGNLDAGLFALVYIALINVPVILLGVRRKWQLLYNLSFVLTIIHMLIWMDRIGPGESIPGMLFAFIYFSEFVALALLKLKHEQKIFDRNADFIRIVVSSVLLLGVVYWILHEAGHDQWAGTAFLLIGLLHIGIAETGYKIGSRFSGEITCFVAGGLFAFAMALPVQFDGAWVSAGWAVEGAIVAWAALRLKSRVMQVGALMLGMVGLLKGLMFDGSCYAEVPTLFLNARFSVGLLSIALLWLQGKFAARHSEQNETLQIVDFTYWIAFVSFLLFSFTDVFWTIGLDHYSSWLLTSVILAGTGAAILFSAPRTSSVLVLGSLCLLAVPVKVFLLDGFLLLEFMDHEMNPFRNGIIWSQLVLMGALGFVVKPRILTLDGHLFLPAKNMVFLMDLLSISAVLGLLSLEINRMDADWADMGITILWALSGLGAILFGMKRRTAAYRYFGLALFGLATLKVLIVDSSELKGLERIGAFMVTGILLLALSFAYQKASAYFQSLEE